MIMLYSIRVYDYLFDIAALLLAVVNFQNEKYYHFEAIQGLTNWNSEI